VNSSADQAAASLRDATDAVPSLRRVVRAGSARQRLVAGLIIFLSMFLGVLMIFTAVLRICLGHFVDWPSAAIGRRASLDRARLGQPCA
jgi:hypothetical protein